MDGRARFDSDVASILEVITAESVEQAKTQFRESWDGVNSVLMGYDVDDDFVIMDQLP